LQVKSSERRGLRRIKEQKANAKASLIGTALPGFKYVFR
jgi:hypothetical protein